MFPGEEPQGEESASPQGCVRTGKRVIREGAAALLPLKKRRCREKSSRCGDDGPVQRLADSASFQLFTFCRLFMFSSVWCRTQGLMDAEHALSYPRSALHSLFLSSSLAPVSCVYEEAHLGSS